MDNSSDISSIRHLPKILIHEHLDCSLRPQTMLDFWSADNFASCPADIDKATKESWQTPETAARYQKQLTQFASTSLANYVKAINEHVLPLMQNSKNLERITKERLEDAQADGVIALELRFAPQLHTAGGLTLTQVMDAVIKGLAASPIPVRLIICALRHENGSIAKTLVDLAIKYKEFVGAFDLAADEKANPGVLLWWAETAAVLPAHGIEPIIHLWETNEPQADDVARLKQYKIKRLGHGIRGNQQDNFVLEICPTSNIVTGQIADLSVHPVDSFLKSGKNVTINTDGTLFTGSSLSDEYAKLQKQFGWTEKEFLQVNLNALAASTFSPSLKSVLRSQLEAAYSNKTCV